MLKWDQLREPESGEERLWELFHENSKVSPVDVAMSNEQVLARMGEMHQTLPYDGHPRYALPAPTTQLSLSVQDAILRRRTARKLAAVPMSLEALASLLSLGYGITSDNRGNVFSRSFRAAPSGGALYPLEIYFHSVAIEGLPPGLFHYNPTRHDLRHLRDGDLSRDIAGGLLFQREIPEESSIVIFLTALFDRSTFKYGGRGYRFALLEAGHVAQNLNLAAVAMGLGVRNMGGYLDRHMDGLLGIDGCNHSTVYMLAIGKLIDDGVSGVVAPE
ncbi:SagB/ThcOx family dehydrogenase [Bradyrhizobium sp.]|uniref:SagB/ThcOx family dehydrogenase n=1 Tax=Bradyrhizobium sp. TaxID=376 RepID=UPI001DE10531|nr:SagB/ThcOx family dehydrogenase [Bradyrhizobium sp.]MBI5318622.1 SagB/ThcOx family dehydrogenase [Bradyrhizobium sp.]